MTSSPSPVSLLPVISVPPCPHRRGQGRYKCGCGHPAIHRVVTYQECQACTQWGDKIENSGSRIEVGGPPRLSLDPQSSSLNPHACVHRGDELRREPCSCPRFRDGIPVHACALHQECVLTAEHRERVHSTTAKIRTCATCPDRAPAAAGSEELVPAANVNLDELAIVTCHFNPAGYLLPRRNYWEWRHSLGSLQQRLITVELSFDGRFTIPDAVQITGDARHVLWQKEALLNLAFRQLPPAVRYVAWIDHDLVFPDPDWAAAAMDLLAGDCDAVQLFDRVAYDDAAGQVVRTRPGLVSTWLQERSHNGSPGGAWMARRELLEATGGLPWDNVIGGGDQAAADSLLGCEGHYWSSQAPRMIDSNRRWREQLAACRTGRTGYLPIRLRHLYHGSLTHRRYWERRRMLIEHDYDPLTDVRLNADGLAEWASEKPALHAQVAAYFTDRREDA